MKTFTVSTDSVYTTYHYVQAHTQEEAEQIAIKQAHDNHHGEALSVEVVDSYEDEQPCKPDNAD